METINRIQSVLQYLLENEIFIDDSLGFIENSDLLGNSKEGWVSRITSLATPHDGSTLTDIVTKTFPFIQYFRHCKISLGLFYLTYRFSSFL